MFEQADRVCAGFEQNTSCRVLRQVFRAAERDAGRKVEHNTGRATSHDQSRNSPAFALKPPKSRRGSREHRITDWPYCIPNRGLQRGQSGRSVMAGYEFPRTRVSFEMRLSIIYTLLGCVFTYSKVYKPPRLICRLIAIIGEKMGSTTAMVRPNSLLCQRP